jgi:penicillin-binding protein activator
MSRSLARSGRLAILGAVALVAAGLAGCASPRSVARIPTDTTTDLSGRWNDTDSREVSEEMIRDCLGGAWITEHAAATGKRPTVIVGSIRNLSLEQIPTGTFVADIERAYVNSGKVDVVATAEERVDVRAEKADQWENATEDTVKRMGKERGADYMLAGSVQSIEDRENGTMIVFYQVDMTLIDLESNRKVWIGTKKIKKEIHQGRYSP